jgi:hypothetical protein
MLALEMPQTAHPKPTCRECNTGMVLDGVVRCADDYDLWSYGCEDCGGTFNMVEARMADHPAVHERRAVLRYAVKTGASIEFGFSAVACMVRNLSAAGAHVSLTRPRGIPKHFTLNAGGSPLPCRLIWHSGQQLGIAFN